MDYFPEDKDYIEERLEEAMPWVGLYIAAASVVCTLAMAADAFNGFRRKKWWFPCKYFSLNATSLTLLGVAMKLPTDITSAMIYRDADSLAKFSSITFMSTAMGNFMSSLGSMDDKDILPNVVALGILVITITTVMLIQLILLWPIMVSPFYISSTVFMLLLLAVLVSLAITVPTTKRNLESKYQEKHKAALMEEEVLEKREAFRIDDQREYMMKYWVMAETSNPQFVMARSVVCTTSAVICLLALIQLASSYAPIVRNEKGESPYAASTNWILYIQCTGVAVGTIAPMFRWFAVVRFKCSKANRNNFKKGFEIESYWIQTLVDWRDSFSAIHIRQDNEYRKYLHDAKWFAITFCIRLQMLIVRLSKLFVFLSALLTWPFFMCFTHIKKSVKQTEDEAGSDAYLDILNHYVLLLEGEAELPRKVLKNICHEADNMIQTGRKKQLPSLVNLLGKFSNFNGVGHFDSQQIQSLHNYEEPPNCWTLPVVTLTSIAIAVPKIAEPEFKQLLTSVSEGLSLAKIVEKTLDKNAHLLNIRKAADVTWVGVVLHKRWLDIELRKKSLECKNSREVLQHLSSKAQGIIIDFKKKEKDPLMENPLYWPPEVMAANSMYRISKTILLSCEGENECTDEGLFERLSVMIADILAAYLTNLPHVITTMCHRNAIEKRDKSVREAFLLLGKTEGIIKLLQEKGHWPEMDHGKAADIEEWRALFRQRKDDPAAATSAPVRKEGHLAIPVDC